MILSRRSRETHFGQVRLLQSRTPGVLFEMTGSARWKPGRTSHPAIEALVRDIVVRRAQDIADDRYADDIRGAEDAINADLVANCIGQTPYFSGLTATVTLGLSERDIANSREFRDSYARVERLRFLKRELYSDPSMLMLDYLDKNPGKLAEQPDLAHFQQLALKVSNGERWWCRILDVLDKLSSEVSDKDGNLWVMNVLIGALKQGAPDIFNQFKEDRATHP